MDSNRESKPQKNGEAHDQVVVDVNKLTYSSADTVVSSNFVMSPKCCIFKIPVILKRHSKRAYTPNAFSIGPWHLSNPALQPTQGIKKKYLQGLINRLPGSDPVKKLNDLESSIKQIEPEARQYYGGPVETKELYKILLLDGCFIIELFRKDAGLVKKEEDDPVFSMSCIQQLLNHDLVLFENQIPWFVLEILFDKTRIDPGAGKETKSLAELALDFFGNIFTYDKPSFEVLNSTNFKDLESKHLLDLLRNSLSWQTEKSSELNQKSKAESDAAQSVGSNINNSGWEPLGNATALSEAGIKFQRVVADTILDIKFNNGTLEIPSLLVQETTETIFRNLISLEQCTPNCPPVFTSYARILDNLIDTEKDMEILCKEKIIDNWLELRESTEFFNKLYNDAYMKEFHYHDLCQQVNAYQNTWWPRNRAHLLRNYFSSPWSIIGVTVAGLVFVMTIIGTVCSIIQAIHG